MTTAPPIPVYAWLTGQHDNIGDSVLRRPYASSLAAAGRLHVWAGDPEHGYISGLGLTETTEVARTFVNWYLGLVGSVLRGRTVLAFNAGEFVVTKGYLAGVLAILPWLPLLRARGGSVVWVGAGVRSVRRGATWPFRLLARACDMLRWRDADSARLLAPAPTMPDWALGLAAGGGVLDGGTAEARDRLAVSIRGDRPYPSPEWTAAVAGAAERLGLRAVVVVQVERDGPAAERLAADLRADLVPWTHTRHIEQERLVRKVYATAAAIISDRLHALVMAATDGAVPLGWCEQTTRKIDRHFAVVGLDWVGLGGRDPIDLVRHLSNDGLNELAALTETLLLQARHDVQLVDAELQDLVRGRSGVSPPKDVTSPSVSVRAR